jgi:hypothetical protein
MGGGVARAAVAAAGPPAYALHLCTQAGRTQVGPFRRKGLDAVPPGRRDLQIPNPLAPSPRKLARFPLLYMRPLSAIMEGVRTRPKTKARRASSKTAAAGVARAAKMIPWLPASLLHTSRHGFPRPGGTFDGSPARAPCEAWSLLGRWATLECPESRRDD